LNFTHLTSIDINGQGISEIPEGIKNLHGLKRFGMVSCCIKSIPAHLAISSIEDLILKGNQISYVHPDVLKIPALKQLYLNCNRLTQLDDNITQGLDSFKLSGNRLLSLPPTLFECYNLSRLELMGSELSSISVDINRLTRVKEIHLQNNKLTTMPPLNLHELR